MLGIFTLQVGSLKQLHYNTCKIIMEQKYCFKFEHFPQCHNTIGHTKLLDCGFSITTIAYLIIISHYINYIIRRHEVTMASERLHNVHLLT